MKLKIPAEGAECRFKSQEARDDMRNAMLLMSMVGQLGAMQTPDLFDGGEQYENAVVHLERAAAAFWLSAWRNYGFTPEIEWFKPEGPAAGKKKTKSK